MTKAQTFNLTQAAAYMGVKYQAVQARFVGEYSSADSNGKHRWAIPLSALKAWQKERDSRAQKLLSRPRLGAVT